MSTTNLKQSHVALSLEESFLAIIMIAVQADKVLTLSEEEIVKATLHRMNIFQSYSEKELIQKVEKVLSTLENQGDEVVLEAAVNALPSQLYTTAFALATDIVLSDGDMNESEENTLSKIQNSLSVSPETASKIIEVMTIKNYNYQV